MRLFCACLLALFVGVAAAQTAPRVELVDRIVAVVNTDVITQRDLNDRMSTIEHQLQKQHTQVPPHDVLQKQVLERMINDKVQLQFAHDNGIQVNDSDVDSAIERIAAGNKLSVDEFRRALVSDGLSYPKFREDIRAEIILSRVRDREVNSRVRVSESEIDNFLADPKTTAATQATSEFNISHILVRVPERASPEQVNARLRRAQDVQQRARGGQSFAELAVTYSDAPDALKGGDIGWRQQGRLPELFATALEKMQPGDVSDILRSPAGFHILKLNDRRGGSNAPALVEQTHARHILMRTSELVSEAEAKRKLTLLRERVLQGADFAELARLNSDDGSAARGGDLGWVLPGDTVPEFERAMNALKPGEISEPIKTPFGWHIIQVLDRRMGDVTGDRKRLEARKILRERKADEAYQEWLRQLRDRAFVDYRLEDR